MPSRLLLDENLSERLLLAIDSLFPGSRHVRGLGRQGAADTDVWDLALQGDFVILTRDEDFVGMSVLRGAPPKVVWLNVGNARNAAIAKVVQMRASDIERFVAHDDYTFLAVGLDSTAV